MTGGSQQRIGRTSDDSAERWPDRGPEPPPGAPNVLLVVLDDVGFAQLGCFGGSVATPHLDRLAANGVRYTDFHTTAVCSPTRASLLTGRHCHAVGFGHVTERLAGYPGYSMRLPDDSMTLAEVLRGAGWATRAVGKWHLTPSYETGPRGPFERWPLGQGFDRFYGFLGGSTDQYAPELVRDNSPVPPPASPRDGYHLTEDLADEAIRSVRELRALAPRHPFFLYLATGAGHAPHQVPAAYADRYRGAFDHGWDVERERVLARQVELGILPLGTELGPPNPGVRPWAELDADERRLYARMMEVYAGFLTHTDAQLGRVLDRLAASGDLENTLVLALSDNGASSEGGPEGSLDEGLYLNDRPQRAADALPHLDALGGPALYNHYPWGWAQAGNTPFRWYKQFTHAGGITNGLVVHWPGGGVPAGGLRRQYHHVVDVVPTVLDLLGVERPAAHRGVTQQPLHGVSLRASLYDADAPGTRHLQHYEMWGNRGLWRNGWMAVCRLQPDGAGAHPPAPHEVAFDDLPWELYDHRTDPTERHDLAAEHPALLRELVDLWWACAGRYDVLPVDVRPRSRRWPQDPPAPPGAAAGTVTFGGPVGPVERGVAPRIAGRSFRVEADVTVDAAAAGALYQVGGRHGGYCWYLRDGVPHVELARSSVETTTLRGDRPVPAGRHRLGWEVASTGRGTGRVRLLVDGVEVAARDLDGLLVRVPIGAGRTWVGSAPARTVAGDLPAPFAFAGVLHELRVTPGPATAPVEPEESAAEMREQ